MSIQWLLLLLAVAFGAGYESGDELSCKRRRGGIPLPLGVFTVQKDGFPDALPAIRTALAHVHNRSCILQGYRLEMIVKETHVSVLSP
uniref:Receptor ligand binding region domain-containing protein n=1 Tax=Caenorhabditis japonica TaxID=281687 RepID=A0A8R1ELM0_CAEJA